VTAPYCKMIPDRPFSKKKAIAPALITLFIAAACLCAFEPFWRLDNAAGFAAKKKTKRSAGKAASNHLAGAEVIADDVFIYKKGLSFYENSEYARAFEYFKYIKEKRPSSLYYDMAVYLCGEANVKMGKPDESIEYYLYLLEKCPSSSLCADAVHTVAGIYKKKGMSGEAIKYYKKLLGSYPDSFWAEEARAFLKYNTAGAGESAPAYSSRKIEEDAVELSPGAKKAASPSAVAGPEEIIDFGRLGIDSYISGRREYEPVDYGGEDLKLYRDGLKFHEIKNYGKARWCYQKLIIKYKNSAWYPNAFYMLAGCYLSENDVKAAIRFDSAALIYAKDPVLINEIKSVLADLLFGDAQYLLALRYYESLAKTESSQERLMQLFFMIGECHTKNGDHERAAKAYARVALSGTEPPENSAGPVSASGAAAPEKPSVRYSKTATPQMKTDITEGVREFEAKNYLKSISFFERLLVENPDEAICYWYMALCFNQIEKPERASGSLQKYISLISSDKSGGNAGALKQAYTTLAYIYLKQGRYEQARAQYLKIIGLDSSSAAAASAREAMKRIEVIKKRSESEN